MQQWHQHTHTHTHALAISWFGVSSSCISTTTMCHTDIIIMTWASFTVREESAALPQNHKLHTRTHRHTHTCMFLYQVRISPSSIALPCPGGLPLPLHLLLPPQHSTAGTHPCVGNFRQFSRFSAASIAHFTWNSCAACLCFHFRCSLCSTSLILLVLSLSVPLPLAGNPLWFIAWIMLPDSTSLTLVKL